MSLLDIVFGKLPEYDASRDPMAHPDEREAKDLSLHVRQCAMRYQTLMLAITEARANIYGTQRLLLVIIALLLMNKVIDFSVLTTALGQ